ncbi:putative sodium hydrogen exchanger [Phaeomoniella chlamydospora]|uniref:Sodium/hydrogen exchanger n=1 Tax=Phaeomoniella chlamydospora TaxID=158046 RepID=A0A0G2EFP1_PHACM|nr:putative sodium hydrogen exchanger [Phaeomoniella chlamydospora]
MVNGILTRFQGAAFELLRRQAEEVDPEEPAEAGQKEIFSSWALFILITLLIIALFTSYILQQKKIQAVHETVISIFAVVLGVILYLWTRIPLDGLDISFVEAISVGATLSATDPVTILAIFNLYKVEPKLYTVIFGESILNDAIAIVLFETATRYRSGEAAGSLTFISLFEAIGIFLLVFFGSLVIGVLVGIGTALCLKYTYVRRFPKIESCLIVLVAYASYFFSNGIHMSGIVSLLFCGITLKHWAYYNMSRRTQLTTKYLFQVLAQLSENFIFIYLGLTLFTETDLEFKPLFILVTVIGICAARYLAVFPLSKAINWVIRYRARRLGRDVAEELPFPYQAMLFWAGLRGAVGVALAAGLEGNNGPALRATVLVVVVLTVIIFGGTTARMLEILGIRTGVVEEIDSDDEFDIETANGGTYYKRSSTAIGHTPKPSSANIGLDNVRANGSGKLAGYSSGNRLSPPTRPTSGISSRKNSAINPRGGDGATLNLLGQDSGSLSDDEAEFSDGDLPPAARRSPYRNASPMPGADLSEASSRGVLPSDAGPSTESGNHGGASLRDILNRSAGDHVAWLKQLDDDYIKPKLLLDQNKGGSV